MGRAKEFTPQKISYDLIVEKNNCKMTVKINGVHIISDSSDDSFQIELSIGEYLRPTDNELHVFVAPFNGNGQFAPDSFCKVSLAGRNRSTHETKIFGGVNYYPTDDVKFNSSIQAIRGTPELSTDFGSIVKATNVQCREDPSRIVYHLEQFFDITQEYSRWNWVDSPALSKKDGYSSPLSEQLSTPLFSAYKELWDAFNRKDFKKLKALHHEFLFESAEAGGTSPEIMLDSLDFEELLKNQELSLAPLSFDNVRYYYSFNRKIVELFSDGVPLIHFIKNGDDSDYIGYRPRFRFDGQQFVIAR